MEYSQDSRNNHQKQEIHYQHHWQSHRSTIVSSVSRISNVMIQKRMFNQNIEQMNQHQDDIVHTIVND